jgi:hypothetical protein
MNGQNTQSFGDTTITCTVDDILHYCSVYAEIVKEKYWELNALKNIVHPSEQDQMLLKN